MPKSYSSGASNKCNYSGSSVVNRPRSPPPGGRATGAADQNALNDMRRPSGHVQAPSNSDALGQELEGLYDQTERLQPQMSHGLPNRN
ncbi:hypothetical protein FLONG3_10971 [Fusarium longipes]|uniref:Uncharacterized protein n=1 Tax=Fusarium longipes TaxID=694270 RepID=A0A395RJB7_9HYPO|nr:hypothetical protein FLONG3_10971 [Fusarium longipes]